MLSSLMFNRGVPASTGSGKTHRALGLEWLLPLVSLSLALLLGSDGAYYAADALNYRSLALGQNSFVSRPFSGRILGAAAAGWLGRATGLGVDQGFFLFGITSLLFLLIVTVRLLWSWRASLAIFAAIFLMPFWVDLFHNYYLPDLLHAAILAAIVLCLMAGRPLLAALLLLPAYATRESTILAVLCLIWAGWGRISRSTVTAAVVAVAAGIWINAHFTNLGTIGTQKMGGASYLLGKAGWSFFHNILGLPPWSNTLPDCQNPIWVRALPWGMHVGSLRMVGLCSPSLWGPARVVLSLFGIFGIGPALGIALFRPMRAFLGTAPRSSLADLSLSARTSQVGSAGAASIVSLGDEAFIPSTGMQIAYRFCFVYGWISLLIAPLLGASTDRLAEYAWPLFFVAIPLYLALHPTALRYGALDREPAGENSAPGHKFPLLCTGFLGTGLLGLHLAVCWIAWWGFRGQSVPGYIDAAIAVLLLNAVVYYLLAGPRRQKLPPPGAALQTS